MRTGIAPHLAIEEIAPPLMADFSPGKGSETTSRTRRDLGVEGIEGKKDACGAPAGANKAAP